MDLNVIRAVVREEIALAMKALDAAADSADVAYETGELESSGLRAVRSAVDRFTSEYADLCEWADTERKRLTDPFTGIEPPLTTCDHDFPWGETQRKHLSHCKKCGVVRPHKHKFV